MLNPIMHSKMQVKQHKIEILPRFRSPYSGENFQINVECLDYTTMGETWEGFRWPTHRLQYYTHMWMVSPFKKKHSTSMSIVQEAAR
jgi:hypothetical protein